MGQDSVTTAQTGLDRLLADHSSMVERIYRQLLIALHTRGIASIDDISDEALRRSGQISRPALENPNEPAAERFGEQGREAFHRLIHDSACRHFTAGEIEDLVNLVLKREEAQSLRELANQQAVSFRSLVDQLRRFGALPLGEGELDPSEVSGLRVSLARHFISDDLHFLGVGKKHLRVRDYEDLTQRIIGSDQGMGRIGGKAGGMLLAYRIVQDAGRDAGPDLPITIPDSYYLRSDVTNQFLELNRLTSYQNQKYKDLEDIRNEYPLIKGVFRNSDFPVQVVRQLRALLQRLENDPLIVRSSSLLEDRMTTAFSGKYSSIFVPNQGTLEVRLHALLGAIGEVYASVMAPDPILYRRKHNLIDYDEDMAVLIQRVVGKRFGKYFLPAFAGVAFSRNEYRWSPRIRREDGFMRLVMGLGTRAVDRVGAEYPRMVALGAPTVRHESKIDEIVRNSQRRVDVINLEENRFDSITLDQLLNTAGSFPMLDRIVSVRRDSELYIPPGTFVHAPPERMCITFDKMLKHTPFAARVHDILQALERELGFPVDMEFVCDGEKFYMLQCRAQQQYADTDRVVLPTDVAADRVVFTANQFVRTGLIRDLDYVVYVSGRAYHAVETNQRRLDIARVVGRLNQALADKRFILMGPGRWGTTDITLGVRVSYADISNAKMLIEIARARDGYVPEVSFGTHFFQDLVEDGIAYLPLYPDNPANVFNDQWLNEMPNVLAGLSPADAGFAAQVRVIHVPAVANGLRLQVSMDGEQDKAIAYLGTE